MSVADESILNVNEDAHLRPTATQNASTDRPEPEVPQKRRKATKSTTWRAWTGTVSDLHRISNRLDELVLARREAMGGENQSARAYPAAEAVLVTKDESVVGKFEDVVTELDPRTWCEFELVAGRHSGEAIRVRITRKPDYDWSVVKLSVSSSDPGFAAQSDARLSEVIDTGRPRWSWIQSAVWSYIVLTLTWAVVLVSAGLVVVQASAHAVALSSLGVLFFVGAAWLLLAATPVIRKVLPPAEIRNDNSHPSSGSRFIGALVAVWIVPMLISLATILISS